MHFCHSSKDRISTYNLRKLYERVAIHFDYFTVYKIKLIFDVQSVKVLTLTFCISKINCI